MLFLLLLILFLILVFIFLFLLFETPQLTFDNALLLTVPSVLVIRDWQPVIPARQPAQGLEIDRHRQHMHAAVAENELADAHMVAAEHRQFADLIKRGRSCQRRVWASRSAGGRRVVAVVDRAVQPTDAETTERHMLLARHQRVAQAVDDVS